MERRGGDRTKPLLTPTMAGGLFSIDRDYFYEIGSYDTGMTRMTLNFNIAVPAILDILES